MVCPDFGQIIMYLSTPTVRSWWIQWVVMEQLGIAICDERWWWSISFSETLRRLFLHSLSCDLQLLVVEISLQFHRYMGLAWYHWLTCTLHCSQKPLLKSLQSNSSLEYLSNNAEVQDEILHGHCILSIKTIRNAQSDLDCWLLSCSTVTLQLKLCISTWVSDAWDWEETVSSPIGKERNYQVPCNSKTGSSLKWWATARVAHSKEGSGIWLMS